MNTIITILAMTKVGAAVTIIILLLVAGAIGYLTAYFYSKSVYTKKIKALEAEKQQLNSHIDRLNSELSDLKAKIKEMEQEKKKGEKQDDKG